jgi:hypothetical protein
VITPARLGEVGATGEAAATGIAVAAAVEAAAGGRVVPRGVGIPGDRGNAARVGPVDRAEPVDARPGVTGGRARIAGRAVTAGRARVRVIFAAVGMIAGAVDAVRIVADRVTAEIAAASAEAPCPRKNSRRLTALKSTSCPNPTA